MISNLGCKAIWRMALKYWSNMKDFLDISRWLVKQYKVSPIDLMWNPQYDLAIWLWKSHDQGHPKLSSGVPKLTLFCAIWITMFQFQLKRKDPSIVESQSIWSFESWTLSKMICIQEPWAILNIGKVFKNLVKSTSTPKFNIVGRLMVI